MRKASMTIMIKSGTEAKVFDDDDDIPMMRKNTEMGEDINERC